MKIPLVIFAGLCLGRLAFGCSCTEPPPVISRVEKSSAVFVGRVTSEEIKGMTRIYRFTVGDALKGELPKEIQVTTPRDSATCGSIFVKDKKYLIFCLGEIADGLATNLCAGNRDASSKEGQKEIGEIKARKAP